MQTYGLVGYPLTQSFSQKYFTSKFKMLGIDAQYLNFSIENISEFGLRVISTPQLKGLNVTIPYKEKIIPFLDELDETAKKVGAVNVVRVSCENEKAYLKGYNSDVVGFERSLLPLLKSNHKKSLILGTGGASKAVKYVLDRLSIESLIVSRNKSEENYISYQDVTPALIKEYHLIVNTTPLGMFPNIEGYPELPYQAIGSNHLCYDLIYNPEETRFLEKSKEQGAGIKNGYEMLVGQAERSWEIWNNL